MKLPKLTLKFSVPYYLDLLSIIRHIGSWDRATRRMTVIFLLSFTGLMILLVWNLLFYAQRFQASQKLARENDRQAELLRREKEHDSVPYNAFLVPLGSMTIEIQPSEELSRTKGIKNIARFEIHLKCDAQKTKEFLIAKAPQAKDIILTLLVGIDREDLQSHLGKKRLKSLMIQKLNAWLPYGRIEDILMSEVLFV